MRRKLPSCPYCGGRMFPQATQDGMISYVCNNADCKAVSPRDRTFGRALNKADSRACAVVEWFDRAVFQPTRPDDYLCEYAFIDSKRPEKEPIMTFYGVRRWNMEKDKFDTEKRDPADEDYLIRIIRWMDFKGGAATRDKGETERRVEVQR